MESDRSPMDESARRSLTASAARVSLAGVTRTFGDRAALQPITLEISPGDFVSLLGPSGSGKSTLLRVIAGLETSDSGSLEVAGAAISSSEARAVSKSFVFQDAALLPWRTVLANVTLPLELLGRGDLAKEARIRAAKEALAQVGLRDVEALYPNQLSGGMKMRVSIARALVSQPSLLLLDEPFAALDERTRFRLQEDLRALWVRTRLTAIFVTHSVSEAVFVSNRTVVLSEGPGRIVFDRRSGLEEIRPASLRTSPAFLREVETLTAAFDVGRSV